MQRVQISTIHKPRGLKGEVKCQYFENMPPHVFIDGKIFTVKKVTHSSGNTYLMLEGITTIEDAERLRGKSIEADRAQINLADDEILNTDLVGFNVTDETGNHLGTIKSIENYGAGEICNCGAFSFPYEDEFVIETNMKDRRIICKSIS